MHLTWHRVCAFPAVQMSGGGQERGLRSGTVPHFLAVGELAAGA